jgi:hypothetical protein
LSDYLNFQDGMPSTRYKRFCPCWFCLGFGVRCDVFWQHVA